MVGCGLSAEKTPLQVDALIRLKREKSGGTEEVKFVADSMLGKLAKWLRILGYDTLYQSYYRPGVIDHIMKEDRCLLSRHKETVDQYTDALLLAADRVGEQLAELKQAIPLKSDQSNWFSRCLMCNVLLKEAKEGKAWGNVPEYVFYQNIKGIRFCPSCGRYYWPGSHRTKMLNQLSKWGFIR
jgi:uncharacterized protein